MVTDTLKNILPVLLMIIIGWFCKKKQVFTNDALTGLKNIIGNILLPVVLFNSFFNAEYNLRLLLVFLVIFGCCGAALGIGIYLKKYMRPYDKFFPNLMTSFEGGMLGYPLYGLIFGSAALGTFASADIGQTMFAYTVFLCYLKMTDGQKPTAALLAKNMVRNSAFIGMLSGVILGLFGVSGFISDTGFGTVLNASLSFISAPTAALILLVIGYELSFKKKLMKPVLKTVGLRFAVMALLCTAACLIVFSLTPFDKQLFVAFLLLFSLPAPFIIPLFADVKGHSDYISTTLSIHTLLTVVLFSGIYIYSVI